MPQFSTLTENKKPTLVSEYGAGGALSQHTQTPENADFSPNASPHPDELQAYWHRKTYEGLLEIDGLCGAFIWCLFDFSSEGRKEGDTVGENDKGLINRTRDGFKGAYRYYHEKWNDLA